LSSDYDDADDDDGNCGDVASLASPGSSMRGHLRPPHTDTQTANGSDCGAAGDKRPRSIARREKTDRDSWTAPTGNHPPASARPTPSPTRRRFN